MYESISSFHLAAGSYVIVMTMPADNSDLQSISNTSVTTSSPITYVDSAFSLGSSLAFPTTKGAFSKGLFGPNFQFDATAAAPEPATWSLMIAGLGLAGAALRRRRSALA
ncbi:MAG: PEPxxWA-CTERM sorting domain-containing protein [Proteobacteria bacterium]|nr:PEPxxWA-CTERM sorting domain-containing protein [Pseudomonadota bacterium]